MEKTAVEWLFEQVWITPISELPNILEQAKEIEQQQIIEAAMWMPKPFSSMEFIPELAKQYYNDKYGDM
jgi:hypothetical protein